MSFAFGLHPKEAETIDNDNVECIVEELRSLLVSRGAVALGEIGLDYACKVDKAAQYQLFEKVLPLCLEFNVPVILHCRDKLGREDASWDCLHLMREMLPTEHPIIFHSFSGSLDTLRLWQRSFGNMYFSFSGLITRPHCCEFDLPAVVKEVPLDKLLIETDAPHLKPRGSPGVDFNTPMNLLDVARAVARLRNCSVPYLLQVTTRNAKQLFRF